MIYRLATEKDISKLSEIRWLHEFEEEGSFDIVKDDFFIECNKFLMDGLKNSNWVYWIAEENEKIISNIYVCRIRKVPKPQKLLDEIGYVTNVHTIKEFRNRGIGTELLQRVKQWAIDNGIELLFVWPSERAINYYEREGFSVRNEIMELQL